MKSSSTMVDKARDLLCQIDVRGNINPSSLSLLLSPGRRSVQAPQIKPNELAIALALLEGDKYKVLVPSDYIAHLRRHAGHNNVEGAYTTHNKIIFWVKDSVLHYDTVEKRADVLKFFIHTAQECRKLRNFSSLVAIAIALHSAPIERLKLTKSSLTLQMQGKLQALYDIIDPKSNHRGYREALNDVSSIEQRDRCIPWLAIHLKELHLVLQRYPITVRVDGRPLINFQRYLKFMDRVNEVLHYKHPDLEQYRQLGQLDYLENQLRNLRMSPTSDDDLMARSRILEARETLDFKTRKPQLRALGFKTR
jgi:son of sevenless-like protein